MSLYSHEEAVKKVGSLFDCTAVASARARELQRGAEPLIEDYKGHGYPVIALMEIAAGLVGKEILDKKEEEYVPRKVFSSRRSRSPW